MEKIQLNIRVYQLVPGDEFWFGGNMRKVVRIDRDEGLLYYSTNGFSGYLDTIRSNSQMIVATKNPEE